VKYSHAKSGAHDWVTAFLKVLAREDLAAVTVRGYRSDLRLFIAWYDNYPIENLRGSDLTHFSLYLSRD
jgi:site-specific recombinase XerD